MKRLLFFALTGAIAFPLWQCNKSNEFTAEIHRFEVDLFNLDTLKMASELERLEAAYPEFSAIFFEKIMGSKDSLVAPEGHVEYVKGFISDSTMRALYTTTMAAYPDLKRLEKELGKAYGNLNRYLPEVEPPDLTTFISEYTVASFIYGENSLALGLDFFLGADYPYMEYNSGNPNFSQYLTRSYNEDHLSLNALKPLVADLCGPPPGNRLLDYMIHNGKQHYMLDRLLPFVHDTVIMEFTPDQLAWSRGNELEVWAHFLREELLYSTDWQDIRKLVEYSPSVPGMPPEAPGRIANWVGWQIVRAYMKRNPATSLMELAEMRDPQIILEQSKYKPGR